MFLVDDILLAPINAIFWLFQEIHDTASQDRENEAEQITAQLSSLYMMLEVGKITEDEFDAQEAPLLDRLDEIRNEALARDAALKAEQAEEDEVDEESDLTDTIAFTQ